MQKIRFKSKEHEQFYYTMLEQSGNTDSYHRAFFYVVGIAGEIRSNIQALFDFKEHRIKPEGLHAGWQTSGTRRACLMAFNLWNGYTEEKRESDSTPYDLFACEFAPWFFEGVKLRYPEYCRELPAVKPKNAECVR